MKQNEKEAR